MPIMAAVAGSAVSAGLGSILGRSSRKAASRAQAEANAIQREQLNFARQQDEWMKNELYPQLREGQEQLTQYADEYGGMMGEQAGRDMDLAQMFSDRLQNTYFPLEDQIVAEARDSGGARDQAFEADRALTDVRQGVSNQRAQAIRTARAYGGDINRIMSAQADNDPMAALSETTAMNRARQMARQLGFDRRLKAADMGQSTYRAQDAAARRTLAGAGGAFDIYKAPASYTLDMGRVMSGAGNAVGGMYGDAGRNAGALANSSLNFSAGASAGTGRYLTQNLDFNRIGAGLVDMGRGYLATQAIPTGDAMNGLVNNANTQFSTGNGRVW